MTAPDRLVLINFARNQTLNQNNLLGKLVYTEYCDMAQYELLVFTKLMKYALLQKHS